MIGSLLKMVPFVGGFIGKAMDISAVAKQDKRDKQADALKAGIDERTDGYKDDAVLWVLILSVACCFHPTTAQHMEQGFKVMENVMPAFWQDLIKWGFAAALGITSFIKIKK